MCDELVLLANALLKRKVWAEGSKGLDAENAASRNE